MQRVSATNALEVGVENPGRERVAAETKTLLIDPPNLVKQRLLTRLPAKTSTLVRLKTLRNDGDGDQSERIKRRDGLVCCKAVEVYAPTLGDWISPEPAAGLGARTQPRLGGCPAQGAEGHQEGKAGKEMAGGDRQLDGIAGAAAEGRSYLAAAVTGGLSNSARL